MEVFKESSKENLCGNKELKGTVSRYIEPGRVVGPKSPFTSAH